MSDGLPRGLSRWSQRKLAARSGGALPADVADPQPQSEQSAALHGDAGQIDGAVTNTPADDAEAPALPDIESLNAESDYTGFLRKQVPEVLKRAALRKLWTSDPALACLDGLNDYDEDFNVIDQVITAAQTSYRPGLGYQDELEKLAADETAEPAGGPAAGESQDEPHAAVANSDNDTLSKSDAPSDNSDDAAQQIGPDSGAGRDAELSGDQKKNPIISVS